MLRYVGIILILFLPGYSEYLFSEPKGHSHNDYLQQRPFYEAYESGMKSIEADVFLLNGKLITAHERDKLSKSNSLDSLYLAPIFRTYSNSSEKSLQLVIDMKESYSKIIPELLSEMKKYDTFYSAKSNNIKIILSGEMPPPEKFDNYPAFIYFDGRPGINYTTAQLERIGMVSADFKSYSKWDGSGTINQIDFNKLKQVVEQIHKAGKMFRFWGTKDSTEVWMLLKQLNVDWIGTDDPKKLKEFFNN